jgi:formylmethanofuran dehydrogenase subunit B
MTADRVFQSVTCLGCGCGCDDLTIKVRGGRIAEVSPPCPLAQRWFGDGQVPGDIRVEGRPATIEQAMAAAVAVLTGAGTPLVVLAPDLTTEAQRAAIAVADALGAGVAPATSDAAAAGISVAQRRGRCAATLGELKNRADVVLFWAVDPRERYPRYLERYAAARSSTHVRRRSRLSVSIGADRGPDEADTRAEFTPAEEVDALAIMAGTVRGRRFEGLPKRLQPAVGLAERLLEAAYVAIVHDAEPQREVRDAQRTEGLVALAQTLNGPTRAALSSLRAGGNRSGAEAALTWQTGYPMRVSFAGGAPRPSSSGFEWMRPGVEGSILLVGSAAAVADSKPALETVPAVVIGPGASAVGGARVAIDTGVAGIHERGTGYRMDDVPLPLTPVLEGPRSAAETLGQLLSALRAQPAGRDR